MHLDAFRTEGLSARGLPVTGGGNSRLRCVKLRWKIYFGVVLKAGLLENAVESRLPSQSLHWDVGVGGNDTGFHGAEMRWKTYFGAVLKADLTGSEVQSRFSPRTWARSIRARGRTLEPQSMRICLRTWSKVGSRPRAWARSIGELGSALWSRGRCESAWEGGPKYVLVSKSEMRRPARCPRRGILRSAL